MEAVSRDSGSGSGSGWRKQLAETAAAAAAADAEADEVTLWNCTMSADMCDEDWVHMKRLQLKDHAEWVKSEIALRAKEQQSLTQAFMRLCLRYFFCQLQCTLTCSLM